MLSNPDVVVAISRRRQAMPHRYRDWSATSFISWIAAQAPLRPSSAQSPYEPGDYGLLPKGTIFRHMPDDRGHVALVIESTRSQSARPSTRMSADTRRSTRRCWRYRMS